MEELKPIHFIDEAIEVEFDQPPTYEKSPPCPDRFRWKDQTYAIAEKIGEWRDYARRGRMARNMTPEHLSTASRRGSWGVGRFFFRVRTEGGQYFDLYYDRAPKNVSNRKGSWVLFRELAA
jgi:hypothetical protein